MVNGDEEDVMPRAAISPSLSSDTGADGLDSKEVLKRALEIAMNGMGDREAVIRTEQINNPDGLAENHGQTQEANEITPESNMRPMEDQRADHAFCSIGSPANWHGTGEQFPHVANNPAVAFNPQPGQWNGHLSPYVMPPAGFPFPPLMPPGIMPVPSSPPVPSEPVQPINHGQTQEANEITPESNMRPMEDQRINHAFCSNGSSSANWHGTGVQYPYVENNPAVVFNPQLDQWNGHLSLNVTPPAGCSFPPDMPSAIGPVPPSSPVPSEPVQPINEETPRMPSVFITYIAENELVNCEVLEVMRKLRQSSIDVRIDFLEEGRLSGGINQWLDECIEETGSIVVCVSPGYKRLVKGSTNGGSSCDDLKGSTSAAQYVFNQIQSKHRNDGCYNYNVLPLLVAGARYSDLPLWMQNTRVYRWPRDDEALAVRVKNC